MPTRSPSAASPRVPPRGAASTTRADWAFTIARRWLYDTADAVRLAALARLELRAARPARGQDPPRGALPPDAPRRLAAPPRPPTRRDARAPRRCARCGRRAGRFQRRFPARKRCCVAGASLPEPMEALRDALAGSGWACARDLGLPGPTHEDPARTGKTAGRDEPMTSAGCTASSRWSRPRSAARRGSRRRSARVRRLGRAG